MAVPFDPTTLTGPNGSLYLALYAGMVPSDIEDEHKPIAEEKILEMADSIVTGLQPVWDHVTVLEEELAAVILSAGGSANELIKIKAMLFGALAATEDFGSLTNDETGLEGFLTNILSRIEEIEMYSGNSGISV